MISPESQPLKRYRFSDLEKWDDDIYYELFDGIPYAMASPLSNHQAVSGEIYRRIGNFLEGRRCKVYHAPYAVLLDADDYDDDYDGEVMFLPDITVVCDPSKRHRKGCKGSPDLVIEILSPSTQKNDKLLKKQKYEKYGVPEYWIVDPEAKTVDVHLLFNGKYMQSSFADGDILPVQVLQGCEINLKDVFDAVDEY